MPEEKVHQNPKSISTAEEVHKCPHCNEEIDHLNYTETIQTSGDFSLHALIHEEQHSETKKIVYECPNCYEEVVIKQSVSKTSGED